MSPTRRAASSYEPGALLDIVAAVARQASRGAPEGVSGRRWDAAAQESGTYVDAPAARRIAEFFGLTWAKVLLVALQPAVLRERMLGRALGDEEQDWVTVEHVVFVLKLIARRLNSESLTPAQFLAESTRMLADDRARRSHGGHLRLPSAGQLARAAGDWNGALRLAGLGPSLLGGQVRRSRSPGIVELIDRFFEHYGVEPFGSQLAAFAKGNGIQYPRLQRPWAAYMSEWKAGRQALGLSVPTAPPLRGKLAPDYSQDVGAARPGERRGRGSWHDPDELAQWVTRYLDNLPRGARASQRDYARWASDIEGAPWPGTFAQHGGWTAMLKRARALPASTA